MDFSSIIRLTGSAPAGWPKIESRSWATQMHDHSAAGAGVILIPNVFN
ncbi:hypothetical protein L485_00405 [Sphingobium baderi LL03]|uniref:Uncharacterized protein n=1 Tax=Sphingobium baderi LL03 TaxID=1114964 RepID=T0H2X5_9SPHN|nr:hypothetical protein L485_00405 [Sphingobium baderi LL03]